MTKRAEWVSKQYPPFVDIQPEFLLERFNDVVKNIAELKAENEKLDKKLGEYKQLYEYAIPFKAMADKLFLENAALKGEVFGQSNHIKSLEFDISNLKFYEGIFCRNYKIIKDLREWLETKPNYPPFACVLNKLKELRDGK